MSYWIGWHDKYEVPDSSHRRRRQVVEHSISQAIEEHPSSRPSIVSLCAGDGGDVTAVLSRSADVVGSVLMVEIEPVLAGRATRSTMALPQVEVRVGDAGRTSTFLDRIPTDVLVLSGVLGNVGDEGARALVFALPSLLSPGGMVVWTRGRSDPDPRPLVRSWFHAAGFDEIAFVGEPEAFGVGLSRLRAPSSTPLPDELFTFVPFEPASGSRWT